MIWKSLGRLFGVKPKPEPIFQDSWSPILEERVPLYLKLPEELREDLHRQVARFIASVRFEGCGGLELTEEMVVVVAAQACLLVLHREGEPYPKLKVVYLYPSTFSSVQTRVQPGGFMMESEVHRVGESWDTGTVVLAWDSVAHGSRNVRDAANVTIHEFAHQLDHEDGPTDGAPALASNAAYRSWAEVFRENYADFVQRVQKGKKTVLDEYGATNAAEFFAVATETFFEKPVQLHRKRPELYEELKEYYDVDPRQWSQRDR